MPLMRSHNWNRAALLALAALYCGPAFAQANAGGQAAALPTDTPPLSGIDALSDALACRIDETRFPQLMRTLRGERAREFSQTYRQYSAPDLDLYQLDAPAQAWGNQSTAVVIAENRVMLAVTGSLDEVTQRLEQALQQSSQSPLSMALDDQHALVIFSATQPGLEGTVLLGCEYRMPGISLLENPEDAWRKTPAQQETP